MKLTVALMLWGCVDGAHIPRCNDITITHLTPSSLPASPH